ncbi:MAG: TetR/AcrR family transcriptional regulator [Phycisphaeraceae bacterium]
MSTMARKSAAELLGVIETPRNARDRLVNTAIDLFYRQGFNAVGLDQIITEAGVTKTTFYKHFASKDDLMVAAVEKRDAWEEQAWRRALAEVAGDDPRAQLLGMFDVLDVWFNDPDFGGCMFLNAAAEFPNPYDPVHQAAAKHKKAVRDEMRDLAVQANAREPEVFADEYIMLLEGTLVMRQVHDRNDAAHLARRMVERLIDEHIPKPRRRRSR